MSKNGFEAMSFEERKQLASQVKPLRLGAHLTQGALAEMVGITRQALSNIERGATPQADTLRRIYEVLGIETEEADYSSDTDIWLGIIGTMLDRLEQPRRDEAGKAAVNAVANVIAERESVSGPNEDDDRSQRDYALAARKRSANRGEESYD